MANQGSLQGSRHVIALVAAIAVAAGTFAAGQWQLRRAATKQALAMSISNQFNQAILNARTLAEVKPLQDAVHRQATLKGFWRPEHTVYLDNRPMDGKVGWVVLTPLVLDDTGQVILVQRGWVQRNFTNRAVLPAITTPLEKVTVRGRIALEPSKLYSFSAAESGPIRQNVGLAAYSSEIKLPLLPVTLLQMGPANEGLLRDWPAPNLGVDKHYGYAFQWFGMCALVCSLALWFGLIAPLLAKRRAASP